MKLRIADRILVFAAGLLLLALFAGLVSQLFFGVDLIGTAQRAVTSESPRVRAALIALAVFLLLLGCYCVLVLFRHRKRKDRFVLQKSESGELAISLNALENMVQKCLDQHTEISAEKLHLENRKEGLLIRIVGSVAGGISIPLTVEALQKQIRQYVTACSGVEIKGVMVQIDSSGEDATDAPFAIAAPVRPLLKEPEEKQAQEMKPAAAVHTAETESESELPDSVPQPAQETPKPADPPASPVYDDDDRPLHQRLFSPKQEPCIVPAPPEEAAEPDGETGDTPEEDKDESESPAEDSAKDAGYDSEEETEESGSEARDSESGMEEAVPPTGTEEPGETEEDLSDADPEVPGESAADPDYLESLKAFDDAVTGKKKEEAGDE